MQCHGSGEVLVATQDDQVILVGNPNVGKSALFGALTGRYVTVSNYPGTTVEFTQGTLLQKSQRLVLIDTPGIQSLIPFSEDERATRDILLRSGPQRVLQVTDTKNLKRGLFLITQLAEMGVPLVLSLNMEDEARGRGLFTDSSKLGELLGIDVINTVATRHQGISLLKEALDAPRVPRLRVVYPEAIEEGIEQLEALLPERSLSKRSLALMLLAGDRTLEEWLVLHSSPETLVQVRAVCQERQGKSDEPLSYVINRVRMEVAESLTNQVQSQETVARSDLIAKFGRWTMDPYLGIPFFLAILYLIYEFVGKFGAGTLVNFLENTFFGGVVNPLAVQVVNKTVPFALLRDLIVGNYGLITVGLTYALAIVLPIVGTFFLTFGLLEDSGYLPRLAVMSDRVFRLMGLNGKAVLPMVLGLGCDTMATLTTRILESKKERLIATILLALAIPCSAQLGVILGMLATLSAGYVIIWALILVVVMLVVGYLASLILPGKSSDFLLEIPPLRVPQLSNILVKTVARIEWYLKEAVPLFLLGTLMLFGLDRAGLLQVVERLASPVISGILGLPSRATEAFIIGFLRRDYGAAGLFALSKDGLLDPTQTLVSLVTITLFIPCIANFFIIVKERGLRTALWVSAFIFPFAVLVGGSLNWALRTWGF